MTVDQLMVELAKDSKADRPFECQRTTAEGEASIDDLASGAPVQGDEVAERGIVLTQVIGHPHEQFLGAEVAFSSQEVASHTTVCPVTTRLKRHSRSALWICSEGLLASPPRGSPLATGGQSIAPRNYLVPTEHMKREVTDLRRAIRSTP
jgi:hypothetical protein